MTAAIQTDELVNTIDYLGVINVLETLAAEKEWKLIEALSADIADLIFARWGYVETITVSTTKVISDKCDNVTCQMTFSA